MPFKQKTEVSAFTYEVRALVDAGQQIEAGAVWTYERIAEIIGAPQVNGNHSSLQKALARLSRDHGIEFSNVRKVGYVRLDDPGIVEAMPADRSTIQRKVKRSVQRSDNVKDWSTLSNEQQAELNASRAILAAIRRAVNRKTVEQVKAEARLLSAEPDMQKTIEFFKKAKP